MVRLKALHVGWLSLVLKIHVRYWSRTCAIYTICRPKGVFAFTCDTCNVLPCHACSDFKFSKPCISFFSIVRVMIPCTGHHFIPYGTRFIHIRKLFCRPITFKTDQHLYNFFSSFPTAVTRCARWKVHKTPPLYATINLLKTKFLKESNATFRFIFAKKHWKLTILTWFK